MNDKELLELAAKAAGMDGLGLFWNERLKCLWDAEGFTFDPLEDDGDALRLAVKLQLAVCVESDQTRIGIKGKAPIIFENHDGKANAATRRAIVKAAAEIGMAIEIGMAMK